MMKKYALLNDLKHFDAVLAKQVIFSSYKNVPIWWLIDRFIYELTWISIVDMLLGINNNFEIVKSVKD